MKTKLLLLSVAMTCAFSSAAMAMTKAEHQTQKDSIASEYKINMDKCASLKANAKDICVSEAKGAQKIAKAELASQYDPTARHTEILSMAKGDAAYDTAKERCDDLVGNTKTICQKDAKAAHVKAKEEARVVRVKAATGKVNNSMRKNANEEENEANYKAAAARCDSMSGSTKDTCVTDTKAKYGMK